MPQNYKTRAVTQVSECTHVPRYLILTITILFIIRNDQKYRLVGMRRSTTALGTSLLILRRQSFSASLSSSSFIIVNIAITSRKVDFLYRSAAGQQGPMDFKMLPTMKPTIMSFTGKHCYARSQMLLDSKHRLQ